jgi:hypothetical protein
MVRRPPRVGCLPAPAATGGIADLTKLYACRSLHFVGKLITSAEAAERQGVSQLRIQQLCRARRIPGARLIGRSWMLPPDFMVTPGTRGPKGRK